MRMIPLHGILAEKGCHSVIQRLLLGTKGLEKEKGEKEIFDKGGVYYACSTSIMK